LIVGLAPGEESLVALKATVRTGAGLKVGLGMEEKHSSP
jgi:hypothetical protein